MDSFHHVGNISEDDTSEDILDNLLVECPNKKMPTTNPSIKKSKKKSNISENTSKEEPQNKDISKTKKTCVYPLTRGKNAGQMCGKTAKFEFEGKWYCGTTKKDDNGEIIYQGHVRMARIAEKNGASKASLKKNISDPSSDPEQFARSRLLKMVDNKRAKVEKHPMFDIIYHKLSNLAVDVNKGVVLGDIREDGTLGPLNDEQKRICSVNNWINNFPDEETPSFGSILQSENSNISDEEQEFIPKNEEEEIDTIPEKTEANKEEEELDIELSDDLDIDDISLPTE